MYGYINLNLKGVAINTSTGTTINGVYNIINNATKPILIDGLVVGTTEYKPFFALTTKSSTSYIIKLGDDGYLTVANTDKITFTEYED